MEILSVKGVAFRAEGLAPESAHHLRTKRKRAGKREREAGSHRGPRRVTLVAVR